MDELIAIGMYAPSCQSVRSAVAACIGCTEEAEPSRIRIIAMVDALTTEDGQQECAGVRFASVVRTDARLSASVLDLRRAGVRVNFQKTRALFGLLLERAPSATWFVKVDTDALLNLARLRQLLASAHASGSDYVGRSVHLFRLRRSQRHFDGARPFTYMQGGVYVLSRRAAASTRDCPRGPWARCPNRYFTDVHNSTVRRQQARSAYDDAHCTSPSVQNNDDLFMGACMHEVRTHTHALFACMHEVRTHTHALSDGTRTIVPMHCSALLSLGMTLTHVPMQCCEPE